MRGVVRGHFHQVHLVHQVHHARYMGTPPSPAGSVCRVLERTMYPVSSDEIGPPGIQPSGTPRAGPGLLFRN